MSESQFPRFLFPQFTEEELQEASKLIHSSVDWTEYNKWVEAGEPFKEHDELLPMNQKLENGSTQRRSAGTKRRNVIRKQKQGNGISSNKSDGKANQKAEKRYNEITSDKRTETTACKESEYCCKISGSNPISNINKVHESNASGSTKRRKSGEMKLVGPNVGSYNVVPEICQNLKSSLFVTNMNNKEILINGYLLIRSAPINLKRSCYKR
ncbi:hypothetical protein GLOIN_2v1474414 [Rhizophagus clarus]|uniref:Uncharacterized protein n=1 Tax=Rhizophagus clarus TaxID=94130 RepID=A0A8H3M4X3_9GLOM|nr:hypothetical protein GLOIN_2v1474414 [Rhizophagus clarus]